jgi:hypothetical protein
MICGRASMIEGATLLLLMYCLVGTGIGAAFGALVLGLAVGFGAGVCAIGAILLISGASTTEPLAAPAGYAAAPPQQPRQREAARVLAGSPSG